MNLIYKQKKLQGNLNLDIIGKLEVIKKFDHNFFENLMLPKISIF